MTDDDLRTRARAAAEEAYRKPRWHVGTVTDRLIEAFYEGFLAHAAQQPSREQIARVLDCKCPSWRTGESIPTGAGCPWHGHMDDAVDAVLALLTGDESDE